MRVLAFLLLLQQVVSEPQGCGSNPPSPSPPQPTPPPASAEVFTAADGTRFAVEVIITNLEIPWSLAFAPDGRLFVTERPGRVRIVQGGTLLPQPALTLADVLADGESGLMGIALHPNFAQNRLVYLVYTARRQGAGPVNRVVRFREVNNTLGEAAVIVDGMQAASIHDGGRIRFGPDGKIYVTMGDANAASNAQTLSSPNGKVLRINEDGTTPGDNPYGSPVYSWGHRNPQGIDWHPLTGDLLETEHGATGNDELNLIERGQNYGWPVIQGDQGRPDMRSPMLFFTPAIAPSGASFYRGSAISGFQDNLFFATLRGQHVHRVRFDPSNPRRIIANERLLEGRFGRIRDIITAPDGALYFCTNNRDGRGTPTSADDRIARIIAAR